MFGDTNPPINWELSVAKSSAKNGDVAASKWLESKNSKSGSSSGAPNISESKMNGELAEYTGSAVFCMALSRCAESVAQWIPPVLKRKQYLSSSQSSQCTKSLCAKSKSLLFRVFNRSNHPEQGEGLKWFDQDPEVASSPS
jgi:hypothetical protein